MARGGAACSRASSFTVAVCGRVVGSVCAWGVTAVAVLSHERGKGVASAAMRACLADASMLGVPILVLHPTADVRACVCVCLCLCLCALRACVSLCVRVPHLKHVCVSRNGRACTVSTAGRGRATSTSTLWRCACSACNPVNAAALLASRLPLAKPLPPPSPAAPTSWYPSTQRPTRMPCRRCTTDRVSDQTVYK